MKSEKIKLYLISGWLITASVFADNPVIPHPYTADPSLHQWSDGRFYIYGSHDKDDAGIWDMEDYHVFSSDNMVDWTDHGMVLHNSQTPWNGAFWAPDAAERNGKYYLYFPEGDHIGVAVSDSPTGPFENPQILYTSPTHANDPAVFEDNGTWYIILNEGDPVILTLKENMVEVDLESKVNVGPLNHFHEGPWVFKRNGTYYLTCGGYAALRYWTSDNLYGPYTYQGNFLSGTDVFTMDKTAHGSMLNDNGTWYLAYHYNVDPTNNYERTSCIDYMNFNVDGTIQSVTPTLEGIAPWNGLPLISFATPETGMAFGSGSLLSVCANASDPDGSIANVKLYLNDQLMRQDEAAPFEWGIGDSLLENMQKGTYVLKLTATDNEGKSASKSISVHIDDAVLMVNFWGGNGTLHTTASAADFATKDDWIGLAGTVNQVGNNGGSVYGGLLQGLSIEVTESGTWDTGNGLYKDTPILDSYLFDTIGGLGRTMTLSDFEEIPAGNEIRLTVWGVGDGNGSDTDFALEYNDVLSSTQTTSYATGDTSKQFVFMKAAGADSLTIRWGKSGSVTAGFGGFSFTTPTWTSVSDYRLGIDSSLLIDFGPDWFENLVGSTADQFKIADPYIDSGAKVNQQARAVASEVNGVGLNGVIVSNSLNSIWANGGTWGDTPILETYNFSDNLTNQVRVSGFDEILAGQEITLTIYAIGNNTGQGTESIYITYNGTNFPVQSTDYDSAYSNTYAQFVFKKVGGADDVTVTLHNSSGLTYLNGLSMTTHAAQTYANWAASWGVNIGVSTHDFDGDRRNNFYEYVFNGNPTNALEDGKVPILEQSGKELVYIHPRQNDDPSLTYSLEICSNLISNTWVPLEGITRITNHNAGAYDEITNTIPVNKEQAFIRLKVYD